MQELRLLAHISQEPTLIKALKDGMDLHSYSASLLFNIPYEKFLVYGPDGKPLLDEQGEPLIEKEMKKKYRNPCKSITFGILYGAGPGKLSKQLNIPVKEARSLMDKYFAVFPKIKELMTQLEEDAKRNKYGLSPLDGRRIDLSGIDWDNKGLVAHAMNQCKNVPFQGAGASTTKLAVCRLAKRIKREGLDAMIVDVIHDEILLDVHEKDVQAAKIATEEEMIKAFNHYAPSVPMKVMAEIGTHWIH